MKRLLNKISRKPKEEKESRSPDQKVIVSFLSGSFLTKNKVVEMLPYILFLGFLGIVYIANGYMAESAFMNIHKLNREVKELRSEYITIKSELNYKSKQSSIAAMVKDMGLHESVEPPKKIVMPEDE